MFSSEFSRHSLDELVTRKDVFSYNVLKEPHLRNHYLLRLEENISAGTYSFEKFSQRRIGKFSIFRPARLGDELVLRKLDSIIRRVYKLKQADRTVIVRQTKHLLEENVRKYVQKLDIKKFYESISRDDILTKLKNDDLLSPKVLQLLSLFFSKISHQVKKGVPRGIGLSATLGELYLLPVDQSVRRIDGVYYYARYVDDIIIFSTIDPEKIKAHVKNILPSSISLNETKCKSYYVGCQCDPICKCNTTSSCPCIKSCKCPSSDEEIEYLGYKIFFNKKTLDDGDKKKKPLTVEISMSEKKVSRIKSRIVSAILDHVKNNDFSLLFMRLRFLTENQKLNNQDSRGDLRSGIYFNYPLLTKKDFLRILDEFMRAQIYASKNSYGAKISASLSNAEKNQLARLSFVSGYEHQRTRTLDALQLRLIRECWKT